MADIERCGIQKNGGKKRWRIKKKSRVKEYGGYKMVDPENWWIC